MLDKTPFLSLTCNLIYAENCSFEIFSKFNIFLLLSAIEKGNLIFPLKTDDKSELMLM